MLINTYDFLSVTSRELQVSPVTVSALTRIAYALFPNKIERVNPNFIPNLWVNRILIELPDSTMGVVDADLWHSVYYYLVHFSGVSPEFYQYDITKPYEDWFKQKVAETPEIEINTNHTFDDIPIDVTREYIDIYNRILISLYVMDAFGSAPRKAFNPVSQTVVEPDSNTEAL